MIRKGSNVTWKWGSGMAEGKVVETFSKEISKTIKGNKALYIEQYDGDKVWKPESEVSKKK